MNTHTDKAEPKGRKVSALMSLGIGGVQNEKPCLSEQQFKTACICNHTDHWYFFFFFKPLLSIFPTSA